MKKKNKFYWETYLGFISIIYLIINPLIILSFAEERRNLLIRISVLIYLGFVLIGIIMNKVLKYIMK